MFMLIIAFINGSFFILLLKIFVALIFSVGLIGLLSNGVIVFIDGNIDSINLYGLISHYVHIIIGIILFKYMDACVKVIK